jgi:hypothetical protein
MSSRARLAAGAAALLAAVALPEAARPQAAEVLTPQDGTAYELRPAERSTVVVPVDVAEGVDAAAVRVELLRVRLGTMQDAVDPGAFRVTYDARPPAIRVAVRSDRAPQAGTYDVSLRITHGEAVQRLALQLERRPATLDVPATVTVIRTRVLPFRTRLLPFRDVREKLPTVRLVERSRQRVTGLVARQLDSATGGVVVQEPPLRIGGEEASAIEPHGAAELAYEIDDPGSGDEARTLELIAPQLAQPVTIAFSIRTRWHSGWIAFWAAIGLAAGFLVRTGAAGYVEVRRQRLAALRLEQRLEDERRRHRDAAFRGELGRLLHRLRELRGGGSRWRKQAEIKEVVDEVLPALDSALADLARRRTAVAALLDALRELSASSWSVPAAVAAALRDAEAQLGAAERRLEVDDVGDAHEAGPRGSAAGIVRAAERGLLARVREEAKVWNSSALPALVSIQISWPEPTHPLLAEVQTAREALEGLKEALRVTRPDVAECVSNFDAAYEAIADLALLLQPLAEDVAAAAEALPQEGARRVQSALARVRKDLEALEAAEDGALPVTLAAHARDLLRTAREEVEAVAAASQRDVAELLDQLDFQKAVAEATRRDELLRDGRAEGEEPTGVRLAAPRAARRRLKSTTRVLQGRVLPPPAVAIRRTTRQIVLAQFARSGVAAVVFLLVAIPLFKDVFVGGFDDVATIVLWAFATDFAVDVGIDKAVALARTAAPARARDVEAVAVDEATGEPEAETGAEPGETDEEGESEAG